MIVNLGVAGAMVQNGDGGCSPPGILDDVELRGVFDPPMARLAPRFSFVVAALLGVVGCTHANPAFEAGEAATGEGPTGGLGSGSPTSSEPGPVGTKTSGRPALTTGPDDTGSESTTTSAREGTTTSQREGSTTSERKGPTTSPEDTGLDSTPGSESTDGVVACDLLGDDCDDGYGCVFTGDVAECVEVNDKNGQGDSCKFSNECASGLACVPGVGGNGCQNALCCTMLCDVDAMDCLEPSSCFSFFENPVPFGLESVGVCLTD